MAGKKELVLYYRPQGAPNAAKLKSVLIRMGIRIRNVQAEQLDQKIGLLTGMEGYEEQEERAEGETLPREMLVMHQFSNARLEEFLRQLKKAGVPRIALKAVVTATNAGWSLRELYQELCREEEAVQGQKEELAEQQKKDEN